MMSINRNCLQNGPACIASRFEVLTIGAVMIGSVLLAPPVRANHQGPASHAENGAHKAVGAGHQVPGASFQVFLGQGKEAAEGGELSQAEAKASVQTVIDAFTFMLLHRTDYPRFEESLQKDVLTQVIVESRVVNDEGKEFPFLVVRTKEPGRVKLLINGSSLKGNGFLGHPETLVPSLAREFQWVVSKADTAS